MEEGGIIDIEFWRLCAAYVFVVLLLIIVKWRGISREKQILLATVRMTVQTHSCRLCIDLYIRKSPTIAFNRFFMCNGLVFHP